MNIMRRSTYRGYTLVETLVVIAIFIILSLGVNTLLVAVIKTPSEQLNAANNIDQARRVLSGFTNEMRNAAVGSDGSYQLAQAGDTQVIFYSTYGTNGSVANRIRYYLSGSTLYKGVIVPTGSPLSYNTNNEVITAVQSNLANGSTPVFYYYDDTYSGTSSPLTQPVNLTQVKFVIINLIVSQQDSASDTSTFTIQGGAAIRSLKTNLGN